MTPFEAILNTLWLGAVAAGIAWAAMRGLRVNAATRCAVWWTVLAAVVLLPLTQAARPPIARNVVTRTAPPLAAPDSPLPIEYTETLPPPRLELPRGSWTKMLAGIWGMVAVGQMLRLAAGFFYLWRLKRAARPAVPGQSARFDELLRYCRVRRRARLLVSQRIGSPVAVGFFRPAVILPEPLARRLSPAELDHVLLHEMAHIARRDDWVQLAAAFLWSVLALHPVAAWVLRRIEREREIACDDWVVAATGAPQPYARSLARLFELCASRPVTILASGIGGRGSNLGDRIALLLERGRAFGTGVSLARVSGFALLLIGMAAMAAHTPAWIALAQTPPPPSDPPREARPGRESFLAGLVAAGYGDLPVDDIINLKNQGVTADYLLRMSRAGWGKLSPSVVIGLKHQGVDPDYVREIHSLGFGPYTPGLMIDLKVHGVPVDLLRALKEYGIAQASAAELIDARNHGLSAHNLNEARAYGSHLTMRQLIRLKQAGVI